jgi:hypothetical protein
MNDSTLEEEAYSDFKVQRIEIAKEKKPQKEESITVVLKKNGDKESSGKPKQITVTNWNVFLKQCASIFISL